MFGRNVVRRMADMLSVVQENERMLKTFPPDAKRIRYDMAIAWEWGCGPIGELAVVENMGCRVLGYEKYPENEFSGFAIMVVDEIPNDLPEWIEVLKNK